MADQFPDLLLSELVARHVDVDPALLRFTAPSTGLFNATFFVEGGPRQLVLRIAPADDAGFVFYERGMMAQEPRIHSLVRERTAAPVAEIIAYDSSRSIIPRDYLIMERLPGVPLTDFHPTPAQRDRVLEQTGQYLREVHSITADAYGYLGEHNCMQPQADWLSAFRIMWNLMVDDICSAGYYDADESVYVRRLLDDRLRHFDRPVTSRLLHMDIWSQNILVDADANVTGLIDFDRALWGDKEIEFAVLDYCSISEPAFWRGYGEPRDTSPSAAIRQIFYLAYEVQKYIVIYHHRNSDPDSALRYKNSSLSLLRQLE